MKDALKFMNPAVLDSVPELKRAVKLLDLDYETDEEHRKISTYISENLHGSKDIQESILRAANQRGFLG